MITANVINYIGKLNLVVVNELVL